MSQWKRKNGDIRSIKSSTVSSLFVLNKNQQRRCIGPYASFIYFRFGDSALLQKKHWSLSRNYHNKMSIHKIYNIPRQHAAHLPPKPWRKEYPGYHLALVRVWGMASLQRCWKNLFVDVCWLVSFALICHVEISWDIYNRCNKTFGELFRQHFQAGTAAQRLNYSFHLYQLNFFFGPSGVWNSMIQMGLGGFTRPWLATILGLEDHPSQ